MGNKGKNEQELRGQYNKQKKSKLQGISQSGEAMLSDVLEAQESRWTED